MSARNILLANRTLRNHIEGDMMHDALRADVLAALLAGSPSEFQEVTTSLQDHASKFRAFIEANNRLVSNAGLRAALGELGPALDRSSVRSISDAPSGISQCAFECIRLSVPKNFRASAMSSASRG